MTRPSFSVDFPWARVLLALALLQWVGFAGHPGLSAQAAGGTVLEPGPPSEPAAVVETPPVILGGIPFSLSLRGGSRDATFFEVRTSGGDLLRSGSLPPGQDLEVDGLVVETGEALPLTVHLAARTATVDATWAPGWYSLLPPLVAILLALLFREVISALFAGVWLGGLAVAGWNPVAGTWRVIDTYAVPALADQGGHAQIVIFSLLLGGMVGVVSRNGGTLGIVEAVAPYASDRRRGQLATWLAGLAIFFDDYANTLIVGNTMRPITDRLKISREKLAYLVDSTAAPIAAIVPISTWVGYEISLIGDGFRIAAEQPGTDPATAEALLSASPFAVFVQTIPYRFYPLLALALAFFIAWTRRDFGSMARAEARAATGGGLHRPGAMPATDTSVDTLEAKEGAPARWWNAALPVLTVVLVVLVGLWVTGRDAVGPEASPMDVFGAADPFVTLLWGSLAGCIVAVALTLSQRILSLQEAMEALVGGMKAMMIAMVVLVLAWSLGAVTETLGTAPFLAQLLQGGIPLQLIPVLVFATAAAISFATGTSWGTMAILVPLVIPLVVALGGGGVDFDGGARYTVLLGSVSSVLAGAIFGDHCSPISDTTVLSSTAAGCDHVDHVRTQLPYALLAGGVGMALGDIPTAYGLPPLISLTAGVVMVWVVLRTFGTPLKNPAPGSEPV